ncbi:MAG: WD40/YVTN/BNR-like repeat-containing protein [Candidatus Binatia bacterium]
MSKRTFAYRGFWSLIVLSAALLFSNSLGAAEWQKLTWDKAPKNKKGEFRNASTIGIVAKNNVYFGFSGSKLAHWNGKSFKKVKYKVVKDGKKVKKVDIRNFVINSEKDIWAFGDNGLALHYDGSKWKNVENPYTGKGRREGRLWGSGCPKPDLCFAGTRGGALIQWDGKGWKEVGSPAEGARIYSMAFPSKNIGWMAGEAFFAKWDGKKWKRLDIEAPRMYDMALLGKNYGWAVGDGGAFFKFDGKTFTKLNVKGSFFRMRGVGCSSKNNCWAGGDAGALFKWDGKGWTKVKLGTFERFNRVKFGHGQGFLVGNKALIYKFTGKM